MAHGKLAGTVDSRVPGCSIHAYHTAAAAHVGRQGRNQRIPLPYRMARPFKWVPPRCLINPLIKSKPPPPPPDPTLAPHSLGTRLICRPCCVRAGVRMYANVCAIPECPDAFDRARSCYSMKMMTSQNLSSLLQLKHTTDRQPAAAAARFAHRWIPFD